MARFIFKLDPLLEQRRREERDRMRAVAEFERERLEIESEAARLGGEMRAERDALRAELGGSRAVDLRRVQLQAGASLHGLRRTRELALRASAVLRRLEAARTELLEATKRRRAVELLRERRREAWLAEQRANEERELDELLTARFGTGRNGGTTE